MTIQQINVQTIKNGSFLLKLCCSFDYQKWKKAQVQNTISYLLFACCTITIKRCKLLIYGAAPQRFGSVGLSENSWALLPCGEEIKTQQTPMCPQYCSLSLTKKPTAELQWCFKSVDTFIMLIFLHKYNKRQNQISTTVVKNDKDSLYIATACTQKF